jgi:hypothetical protein
MSAQRIQMDPNAVLSLRVVDAFGNPVILAVVGPADLQAKPANFAGG